MKKKPYHHGDVKNALLAAAIDIIKSEGIEMLSIRTAAKKIGVSHTAPYRHYKTKEDLVAAIAIHGFQDLLKALDEALIRIPNDPYSQLIEIGKAYIRFAMSNPVYYRVMFGDFIKNKTEYPDLFKVYDGAFRKLLAIIEKYPKKTNSKSDPPEIIALAAWSMVHGYSCLIIDNKKDKNVGSEAQIHLITKKLLTLIP